MPHLLDATYVAEQRHFWFQGLARFSEPLLASALAGRTAPLILDCGFGTGANMARLAKQGRVFGFDITTSGVRYARTYGQTNLAQGSITDIPFAGATFDLVTAFDVLVCIPPAALPRALAEIDRVLKPGGALVFNMAALPSLGGNQASLRHEVHRSTRGRMHALLRAQRFRIARLTYTNFTLLPLLVTTRMTQRLLGWSSLEESGVAIPMPPAWINQPLTAVLTAEAWMLRYVDMPVGSSLLGLAYKAGAAATE